MKTITPGFSRRQILTGTAALACSPLLAPLPAFAKAPMLGVNTPKHYRFKLGDFEVTTIVDSEVFIDGPYPIIGKNASEAEVIALMRESNLPPKRYQPGFSPTIINTGRELVLFDTGNGEKGFVPRPAGGLLAAQLAPAGFNPADIDLVILSHGHPDHVGGLMEAGNPLFPNARYAIGAVEHDYWTKGDHPTDMLRDSASLYRENTRQILDKFTFIKPGDEVTSGITAIGSYGHTPGHLSFHIDGGAEKILFWGDCAHHHVASLASPAWHCVFDVEKEAAAKTRVKIFDMAAADKIAVIGYHMPFPSIGYVERRKAGGYAWQPHSFQLTDES